MTKEGTLQMYDGRSIIPEEQEWLTVCSAAGERHDDKRQEDQGNSIFENDRDAHGDRKGQPPEQVFQPFCEVG